MMRQTLCAFTPPAPAYPPYFNVERDGDEVIVTVRSAPSIRAGVRICSRTPGPGLCVAGETGCNNYCNMAPQLGPMQDRPERCTHTDCGPTASMRMPLEQFCSELRSARAAS
jgi:hypothetical protein